jgi:hypothetical protein
VSLRRDFNGIFLHQRANKRASFTFGNIGVGILRRLSEARASEYTLLGARPGSRSLICV